MTTFDITEARKAHPRSTWFETETPQLAVEHVGSRWVIWHMVGDGYNMGSFSRKRDALQVANALAPHASDMARIVDLPYKSRLRKRLVIKTNDAYLEATRAVNR